MKTQSFLSIYSITVNHGFTAIWATESTHRLNAPKVITRKTYAVNFQFLRRTKFARNSACSRTFLDEKSLVRCEFESILRNKKKIPTAASSVGGKRRRGVRARNNENKHWLLFRNTLSFAPSSANPRLCWISSVSPDIFRFFSRGITEAASSGQMLTAANKSCGQREGNPAPPAVD